MISFGSRSRPVRPTGDALVVEADRAIREALGTGLIEMEWRPHLAFDVSEALELMHLYEPHVVLLDAHTTARELELLSANLQLNWGCRAPILAVGPRGDEGQSGVVGAYDYLGVPFPVEELGVLVERGRALYERGRHLRRFSEAALGELRNLRETGVGQAADDHAGSAAGGIRDRRVRTPQDLY